MWLMKKRGRRRRAAWARQRGVVIIIDDRDLIQLKCIGNDEMTNMTWWRAIWWSNMSMARRRPKKMENDSLQTYSVTWYMRRHRLKCNILIWRKMTMIWKRSLLKTKWRVVDVTTYVSGVMCGVCARRGDVTLMSYGVW